MNFLQKPHIIFIHENRRFFKCSPNVLRNCGVFALLQQFKILVDASKRIASQPKSSTAVTFAKNNDSLSPSTFIPVAERPFIELTSVGSTNNYAMTLAKTSEAQHGMAVFAHHQTAGKGQRGKVWKDAPGQNIALSVLLNASSLLVSWQFRASVAVAIAAQRFFSKYALDDTKIKWPNDIYWRDRKAAGILVENLIIGQEWQWAIAGIGVNINQAVFEEGINNAVSLRQITGKQFDTVALARELASMITESFDGLTTTNFNQLLQLYNSVLYKRKQEVRLKKNSAVFTCTVEEVNENGELVTSGALPQNFRFGEVEWVLPGR